ncbi:MAG: hypothetical protein V1725_03270 [archaeon]
MMKYLLVAFLLLLPLAHALSVTITTPELVSDGEHIRFSYTILNNATETMTIRPYIVCKDNPVGYIVEQNITVEANTTYSGTLVDYAVTNHIQPGPCTAILELPQYNLTTTHSFLIDTQPVIRTQVMTCADSSCASPRKVFFPGETVYVSVSTPDGYDLDVQGLEVLHGMAQLDATLGYYALPIESTSPYYKGVAHDKIEYAVIPQHPRIALKRF